MIGSWRSKALRRFFETGSKQGIDPRLAKKIRIRLDALDAVENPAELPVTWRPHPLKGGLRGFWPVGVSGNWRILFRFEGRDVFDVDLQDTH